MEIGVWGNKAKSCAVSCCALMMSAFLAGTSDLFLYERNQKAAMYICVYVCVYKHVFVHVIVYVNRIQANLTMYPLYLGFLKLYSKTKH